ncbi:peptidase C39 [Dysosmobacter sp.]|uniref:peptidase C39 n=1 Tax=Dysosmobacter sp. TaxID=2591382 RepID=UPI002A88A851|nr:peptidase C39 [Dysosmobacter sp.]MDY3281127.1 peptidase C39 [Dysosmobacter sp.]
MDNPLRYQMTEYDCGPTSMLNGVSYLFRREEIPPEIVRSIMLYCLDCFGADGASGKRGTSCMAMMFLSNWINSFGQTGHLPISSQYLSGREVNFSQNGRLRDSLRRGGAAVARVDFEDWHYVLLTAVREDRVYLFDPYYRAAPFDDPAIQMDGGHPWEYNRVVPAAYLERTERMPYALGPAEGREAVLLFNDRTVLTQESTVEYMI